MTDTIDLAVITGSVREGRQGPMITRWIAEQAREHGAFDVTVADLADFDLPTALPAMPPKDAGDSYPRPEGMLPLTRTLARADAFVLVTPEINHSYPASLKTAIDWHYTQWAAKPVAVVGYGGSGGGHHAVLHLENVFTELHAVTVQARLTFPYYRRSWDGGQPVDPGTAVSAKAMFTQLAWWADALRRARATSPYPG